MRECFKRIKMGYSKKWKERVEKGMCGNCGKHKPLENKHYCQDCSDYFKEYYKKHYARTEPHLRGGKTYKIQRNATHMELQSYISVKHNLFKDDR